MEDAESSLEVVDRSPELGTRREFATASPFSLSVKFDWEFISKELGERMKTKTYRIVGIAQVECKLCIVSEGLINMIFSDLRPCSIEFLQRTIIRKFTSPQYKGIRLSIIDWDRMIKCT